eukprot:symbB.v1.2.011539.t2/scaffold778.1/size163404/22
MRCAGRQSLAERPLGGNMADPHPRTVCHVFGEAGCTTVRFNFRSGIGSGNSSLEDVKAVAAWLTTPRDAPEAGGRIIASKLWFTDWCSCCSRDRGNNRLCHDRTTTRLWLGIVHFQCGKAPSEGGQFRWKAKVASGGYQ